MTAAKLFMLLVVLPGWDPLSSSSAVFGTGNKEGGRPRGCTAKHPL